MFHFSIGSPQYCLRPQSLHRKPAQLKHLAQMASAGLARCIVPAFTTADGDTVYAISVGPDEEKVTASLDAVGALSAKMLEEAIADAVYSAQVE